MSPRRSQSQQRALRQGGATPRVRPPSGGGGRRPPRTWAESSGPYRQRRPWWAGPLPIVGVLVLIAVVVVVFVLVARHQANQSTPAPAPTNAAAVVQQATHVPAGVYDSVGTGSVSQVVITATKSSVPLTGPDGKPELLYIGAVWCPYCAAERWVMVTALSRFGTFSNVGVTSSTSSDVDPNTPTFSFANAKFTSPYLDFVPVETQDRNHNQLATPTSEQSSLMTKYDSGQSIPFLMIGGAYTQNGASYDPGLLSGKSASTVAHDLQTTDLASTQAIIGNANLLTAAICQETHGQPASVCRSAGVVAAAKKLPATS